MEHMKTVLPSPNPGFSVWGHCCHSVCIYQLGVGSSQLVTGWRAASSSITRCVVPTGCQHGPGVGRPDFHASVQTHLAPLFHDFPLEGLGAASMERLGTLGALQDWLSLGELGNLENLEVDKQVGQVVSAGDTEA